MFKRTIQNGRPTGMADPRVAHAPLLVGADRLRGRCDLGVRVPHGAQRQVGHEVADRARRDAAGPTP